MFSSVGKTFDCFKDQIKGFSAFIRAHDNFTSIDQESDIGISSSFFNHPILIEKLPDRNFVPFDTTYLIYTNFIKSKKKEFFQIFTEKEFKVLISKVPVSAYDIKYYSRYLICNKNFKKTFVCHHFPNIHAMLQEYLI